ncbi:hypothetical protein SAMN04489859_1006161 [Paracoccus alcaliphilus]|uniref:Uncharacterized protein n=1 Tax=Paracoccus alcaliphilus TaxID=34002 RepID=A0A1H8GFZ8_9RHOB|nr:hypothetical protein [Paracoccus alcaliphilus]WCR17993.1 hypothetical protein JHW40_17135 [Paracoccus alcaliphilus]SEN42674.1 hypothetical protein SAMN04489859_1006161 [Paracoccus alcaliphilus]
MTERKKKSAPPALIAAGREVLRRRAAQRHLMPKCGAIAKHSGQPCRHLALANGRCQYHGGKTPKGKNWHRMQLPDKSAPNAWPKTEAKLWKARKDQEARAKRLARMTPEERAAHDKWHRDRPLGTPEYRQRKKLERQQNAETRARWAEHDKAADRAAAASTAPAQPETVADDHLAEDWIFG